MFSLPKLQKMCLTIKQRNDAFAKLGRELSRVALELGSSGPKGNIEPGATKGLLEKARVAYTENQWFTPENVGFSLCSISHMLDQSNLEKWLSGYAQIPNKTSEERHVIGVVMAGNLPLVGFHDFLCVLVAGYCFVGKLSSKDAGLTKAIASILIEIEPNFKDKISFVPELPPHCYAVIATGSDNSARYFEHAFGSKPHLFRKNRNSVAILSGRETCQDLELLGNDVFSYFGLGCRSVSKLYVPNGYNLNSLKKNWKNYSFLASHNGYSNNLIYNKALLKVAEIPHVDFGFCTLKYDFDLASPISVINIEEYETIDLCQKGLKAQEEKLQCIVGNFQSDYFQVVPFGQSQSPNLWDYADGVDTMEFLINV